MKERPILFSAAMVRAILAGSKTQTRRVVKPQSMVQIHDNGGVTIEGWIPELRCPYGIPGDRLWVRETFAISSCGTPVYRADARDKTGMRWHSIEPGDPKKEVLWKPSIFMRREYSRLTLDVTAIRVERLNELNAGDAVAEGVLFTGNANPIAAYTDIWESIHVPGSWALNPWVWVVEFRKVEA